MMLALFLFIFVLPIFDGRTIFRIGMDELMYRLSVDEIAEPGAFAFQPVTLRFGLKSYSNSDEVKRLLANSAPNVVGRYRNAAKNSCPQFNSLMLSFPAVVDLEHEGEMYTHFINDHLHAVYFLPVDYTSYLEALTAAGIQIQPSSHFLLRFRGMNIKKAELNRVKNVLWYDVRLDEEISTWFRLCS